MQGISRMPSKFLIIKYVGAAFASAMLLAPGALTFIAWGVSLNLEISFLALLVTLAITRWVPALKWLTAIIASVLIAVPPFPYWLRWSKLGGYEFHLFAGFSPGDVPWVRFILTVMIAMLLFSVIIFSIGGRERLIVRKTGGC